MSATISDSDVSTVEASFEVLPIRFRNSPIEQPLPTGFLTGAKWSLYAAGTSLIAGTVTLLWSSSFSNASGQAEGVDWKIILTMAGVLFLTFAAIGAFVAALYLWLARRAKSDLAEIRAGRYFAFWKCESEQWAQFIAEETIEAGATSKIVGWSVFGFIGLSSLIFAVFFQIVLLGLIGTTAAAALGALASWITTVAQSAKLERWSKQPWFTVFGAEGVYYDNQYRPYSSFYGVLHGVEFLSRESGQVLELTFQKRTNEGYQYDEVRLPVPRGKETEADRIASMLS